MVQPVGWYRHARQSLHPRVEGCVAKEDGGNELNRLVRALQLQRKILADLSGERRTLN